MSYRWLFYSRPQRFIAPMIKTGVLLLVLGGARIADAVSIDVDGLDRKELRRSRVSVALVRVEGTTGGRELKLLDLLIGSKPPPAALKRIKLGRRIDASWPEQPRPSAGRFLLMCWIRGAPCGPGATVSLGPRLRLPMALSGETDDRVSGVRTILSVVKMVDDKRRVRNLVGHFRSSNNAYLVLLADAALIKAHRHHRRSAARYLRLLSLVAGAIGEDEALGSPLIKELLRFPEIRTSAAYRRWRKNLRSLIRSRSWAPFAGFRARVQSLLRISAESRQASSELRRWALRALAAPPSFIARKRDPLDRKVIELMEEVIRDPSVEIRRGAISALLSMSSRAQRRDRRLARRLRKLVLKARDRERSPEERKNIQRLINAGAE